MMMRMYFFQFHFQEGQGTKQEVGVECKICTMTIARDKSASLGSCSHDFCNDCWREYLETQLTNQPASVYDAHIDAYR